jgi:hypothetical protein
MNTNAVQLGPREYPAYVEELCAVLPEAAREVAAFTGIGQVLEWMQQRGLDLKMIDFVPQDEFEYDFMLEWERGGRWLSFGAT